VGPPLRTTRSTRNLIFFAAPGDVANLAVATGSAEPGSGTTSRGVLALDPHGESRVRDIPWLHLTSPPVMASTAAGWIALIPEPDAFGPTTNIWLWREHSEAELLAKGDQLSVVDAHCQDHRCVVLTTRAAEVATAGASLWTGNPDEPPSHFERMEVLPKHVEADAVPVAITRFGTGDAPTVVAFESPRWVSFVRVSSESVEVTGKSRMGETLLAATSTRDALVAVMTRGKPDADGCVGTGGKVEIAVAGGESELVASAVPPESGYARRLGDGAFVTWIAPVNCRAPERKVVHGAVLGPSGHLVGSAMAMGNADGHAVTTKGDEVHVWLRDPEGVTWLRARCNVAGR